MEKGMIKMIIKVTVIAIVLLTVSLFLLARYGGMMMKSVSTSEQTSQDNETGTSNSTNQNKK